MSERANKVAEALKEEISNILREEINDPRIGFVTLTRVEVKDDLRFAKIYFSVMGNEEDKKSAQEGLASATGYIRKLIGERIKLRYTPEITFKLDRSIEYSQHIADVLEKLKREREKKGKDVT